MGGSIFKYFFLEVDPSLNKLARPFIFITFVVDWVKGEGVCWLLVQKYRMVDWEVGHLVSPLDIYLQVRNGRMYVFIFHLRSAK